MDFISTTFSKREQHLVEKFKVIASQEGITTGQLNKRIIKDTIRNHLKK